MLRYLHLVMAISILHDSFFFVAYSKAAHFFTRWPNKFWTVSETRKIAKKSWKQSSADLYLMWRTFWKQFWNSNLTQNQKRENIRENLFTFSIQCELEFWNFVEIV